MEHTAAAADQLTLLKASLRRAKGSPRHQPTVAGDVVTFTIPADEVQTMKELKLSYTYRLARDAPAGTELVATRC